MNEVETARLVGAIAILLLFSIKFYIVIDVNRFRKSGRVAMLWTIMYVFFLFMLRLVALLNLLTTDQLAIVGNYTTLIPLTAVIVHLFLYRSLEPGKEKVI